MSKVSYYTEEGLKKLRDELNQLKDIERPKASQAIADARDKGDLSENAEYDAAKESQGLLELRISKLEEVLSNARIVINYDYNYYNANGTDDVTDDIIERKMKTSSIPFGGVSINLYDHTGYSQEIVDEINLSKENNTSKKIYLNDQGDL